MKVLILGAAGMIGRKLVNALVSSGLPNAAVSKLVLYDIVMPQAPEADFPVQCLKGDLSESGEAGRLAELDCDLVFHLASIVSGEAETDFDLGWNSNLRASWALFEAIAERTRKVSSEPPKIIFSSSIAVFGGPYDAAIDDEFLCAPQSSYGAQKACIELILADYCRKGFFDGMSVRLPTICVRPGKPNLAASSFFSGIIREPLNGQEALLPVETSVRHWFASPESAVGFLLHAADLDTQKLEGRRALNLPGVSCTVEEQIEALRSVAGEDVVKLIKPVPDARIRAIVDAWPEDFTAKRALKLGFKADDNFEAIVRNYIDKELSN
ncbi:MAG: SDR family oxidoreductase [Rhizobiaceae bacterium]|nr:SDR family oxidoreductase [Rhizobiaceae bacterium]